MLMMMMMMMMLEMEDDDDDNSSNDALYWRRMHCPSSYSAALPWSYTASTFCKKDGSCD